jgi:aminopeptidase N
MALGLMAQDGYIRNIDVDILGYEFYIKISDNNDSIQGLTSIELECRSSQKTVKLDLVSVADGKGMFIESIKNDNGDEYWFRHENDEVLIDGDWTKGRHNIKIKYAGVPADGLIISKNKHGDRTFFCDNWPNRAHHYIPVVDHPSEKAYSSFTIEAPSYYQVVSNGLEIESSDLNNGNRITKWESAQVLPTKVMVFGAAKFAVERAGDVKTDSSIIPVYSWVYPQERNHGFYDYALNVEILDWFQNKLGAYPYDQLNNVQSKTRYGGMENAGCIFYHENSIDGKHGSESLFAHEIAHQWFGNSASEADWHHVWLSEGFATYLTEVYKQENISEQEFKKGMKLAAKRVFHFTTMKPNASVIDTTLKDYNQLLNACTYQKAAWVLHGLRQYMGDSLFWKGVRTYYTTYQYGNAYTNDFAQVMHNVSGLNVRAYLNAWLYQPGFPSFKHKLTKKTLIVEQVGKHVFPVSLEVLISSKNSEQIMKSVYMSERKIEIPVNAADVKNVLLDPNGHILKK